MSIIPVPAHLEERPGELTLPVQISIACKGKGSSHVGAYLQRHLSDILHLQSTNQASCGLMRSLPHNAVFTCDLPCDALTSSATPFPGSKSCCQGFMPSASANFLCGTAVGCCMSTDLLM